MAKLHWATSRIHFPINNAITARTSLPGSASAQCAAVLGHRVAWAVLNNNFEIADFLSRTVRYQYELVLA